MSKARVLTDTLYTKNLKRCIDQKVKDQKVKDQKVKDQKVKDQKVIDIQKIINKQRNVCKKERKMHRIIDDEYNKIMNKTL